MNNLIKAMLLMAVAIPASAQNAVREMSASKIDQNFSTGMVTKSLELSKANRLHTEALGARFSSGGHDGNGGDMCENKIKNIINDIDSWLMNDQFKGITLPSQLSETQYKKGMLEAIKKTNVMSCTTDKIYIKDAEKTCKNFENKNGDAQVICNFDRLMKTSDKESYKLIHHELAGIAGYEINNGSESSIYIISNQISDYLRNEVVTKLGVKSSSSSSEITGKRLEQGDFYYYQNNVILELNKTRETEKCSKYPLAGFYIETIVQGSNFATLEKINDNSSLITFIGYGKDAEMEYRSTFLVSNDLEIIKPIKMEFYKISVLRVDKNGHAVYGKELVSSKSCE